MGEIKEEKTVVGEDQKLEMVKGNCISSQVAKKTPSRSLSPTIAAAAVKNPSWHVRLGLVIGA